MKDKSVEELMKLFAAENVRLGMGSFRPPIELEAELKRRFVALESEVTNLKWWREHGQKLRNAIAENIIFTDKCDDDALIAAPQEAKAKIKSLEAEVKRLTEERDNLKCCGNCIYLDCCVDRSLQSEDRLLASRICKDWQSDSMTKGERRK